MSVQDTTVSFQDRRDEDPKRVVVIFTDIPDGLTKRDVKYLFSLAERQAMAAIDAEPDLIKISKLRAALANGDISQAVYDALTDA